VIPNEIPQGNTSREKGTETYAIFRKTLGRVNIGEIGKTVAKIMSVPLVDVTTRLFTCSGLIADNLTESQKDQICALLQELGISHFVVNQKDVLQLPKLVTVETVAFDRCGFQFTVGAETATYTWDNILLINAGRFETVSRKVKVRQTGQAGDERVPPLTMALFGIPISQRPRSKKTKTEIVKQITHRIAIDVFMKDPWSRFRLLEQTNPYKPPDENQTCAELERFRALAQDIVQFATDTFIGEAVKALAQKSDLSSFTYNAKRKFDLLNFYLLNLAKHS
jgi:hypothetical protein